MRVWYISTPMNGRTEKEIRDSISLGKKWVASIGDDYYDPYMADKAEFNSDGQVVDKEPITMLCEAMKPLDKCHAVLFVGCEEDLYSSRGCQVEKLVAELYDKEFRVL